MRRLLLMLCCLPLSAPVIADELCDMIVRRHAGSVCRTNIYDHEDCLRDGSQRVCSYTIVMDNGVEKTTCQTCIATEPPPGPAHQDCIVVGESGGVSYITCDSPIIINTDDADYPLTGGENPVSFDLNADGVPEHMAWTAPNSTVAFLALDRNHNGVIDDGSELFGNHTPGANGIAAANGFEALAAFDTNADGLINPADSVWTSLLLWTDRNHDGRSAPSELRAITFSPVTAISLDYRTIRRRDEFGNLFRYEGYVQLEHGRRRIYDVFFSVAAP